ncbi:hypothetical protein P3S67_009425 [Capsicum chacoense]|uniref:uncharacterized protein LOC107875733 n=1 Tax=Capsicum annuum TaxID=4072 RepID=UPI0007BEB561|nr:uncharacterized protein LOC107875733 [Capsicum annuum]KAF3658863.1 putative biotin synthase-like [Capsicum annuum]KAF3661639.1 putative biotin synthase-like [Capsicum annuum]
MVMWGLSYLQNLWPFSLLNPDELKISDGVVRKLSIPESTKQFVYAIQEQESKGIIYVLCVQNLSERSAVDAECLIREVKPEAVVVQVGNGEEEMGFTGGGEEGYEVPTSSIGVLKRCFVHKTNKEKYENVAGLVVLREIFGVGFDGHLNTAKKAAEEVGSAFLLLESPFVKCSTSSECDNVGDEGYGDRFGVFGFEAGGNSLVPLRAGLMVSGNSRGFRVTNDVQSQMVRLLSSHLVNLGSLQKIESGEIQQQLNYQVPQFAQTVYPLLVDLYDIFVDIPSIGRGLACAQKLFRDVCNGDAINTDLLSEVYVFKIAVEGLRIALNNAGRIPLSKMGCQTTEFSELSIEDKCHALLAQALRSQTEKFKSIVAVVDANGLAGLRKHWNINVPEEVKEIVEQLVTDSENDGENSSQNDRKGLLTVKPVVAVGAGATAVLGASSFSKVVPASTVLKVVTFKVPASLKIMMTQTQKAFALAFGKSHVVGPAMASNGVKSSVLKAAASAEKIRAVTHGVIASAEKTSISAMRTAFYEIMRKHRVRPVGFLPWATFGCSVATCAGLLVYGDGIECAAESLPAAPSIASLGRGIQSLHQASKAVKQTENSRIQKSIESFVYRFKKISFSSSVH